MLLLYIKSLLCGAELIFLKLHEESCCTKANAHSEVLKSIKVFIWRQDCPLNLSECISKILCSNSVSLKLIMPRCHVGVRHRYDFCFWYLSWGKCKSVCVVKLSKAAECNWVLRLSVCKRKLGLKVSSRREQTFCDLRFCKIYFAKCGIFDAIFVPWSIERWVWKMKGSIATL